MLTRDNYFSPEMTAKYMSASQFKAFERCPAAALQEAAMAAAGHEREDTGAFREGRYFEAAISGEGELFGAQNPGIYSSRGPTKGGLKANFKKAAASAGAFLRQPLFRDVLGKCARQVVVTGEIAGVPFKGMVDFLDMETFDGYDAKCMKDFGKVYSPAEKMRVSWYFAYGYHYQMAIYSELVRQTYGRAGRMALLAATKEDVPDVAALYFSDEMLENALEIVREYAPMHNRAKQGAAAAERCGACDWCKRTKLLRHFEAITEFE